MPFCQSLADATLSRKSTAENDVTTKPANDFGETVQDWRIVFYQGPEPDGKRIRKLTEKTRPCVDAAEAAAYAARCLVSTSDELRSQVVRVIVEVSP